MSIFIIAEIGINHNGKLLITSINTKWNLFLYFFEILNLKNKSKPRSYIHPKKINTIAKSAGFELIKSYSRQIFPFKLLRIGNKAIVSFPNFGHWRIRTQLMLKGRMPITKGLPYSWYETPNIHFFTIKDFYELCRDLNIIIEKSIIVIFS